jgi:hypothetical protein
MPLNTAGETRDGGAPPHRATLNPTRCTPMGGHMAKKARKKKARKKSKANHGRRPNS